MATVTRLDKENGLDHQNRPPTTPRPIVKCQVTTPATATALRATPISGRGPLSSASMLDAYEECGTPPSSPEDAMSPHSRVKAARARQTSTRSDKMIKQKLNDRARRRLSLRRSLDGYASTQSIGPGLNTATIVGSKAAARRQQRRRGSSGSLGTGGGVDAVQGEAEECTTVSVEGGSVVETLSPGPVVLVRSGSTVLDAVRRMVSKGVDAVVVADDDGGMRGILTDKDVVRSLVTGPTPARCTVDQAMTPDPTSTLTHAPANEALRLMIRRGFRHLPVIEAVDESGGPLDPQQQESAGDDNSTVSAGRRRSRIKGMLTLLDALPCALSHHDESVAACGGAEKDKLLVASVTAAGGDAARDGAVLDVRATTHEAALRMVELGISAVAVVDSESENPRKCLGVLTSKDVMLRVVAQDCDPQNVTVVRVMTKYPDSVKPDTPAEAALRRMRSKRYLHLPVCSHGRTVGVVDAMQLARALVGGATVAVSSGPKTIRPALNPVPSTPESPLRVSIKLRCVRSGLVHRIPWKAEGVTLDRLRELAESRFGAGLGRLQFNDQIEGQRDLRDDAHLAIIVQAAGERGSRSVDIWICEDDEDATAATKAVTKPTRERGRGPLGGAGGITCGLIVIGLGCVFLVSNLGRRATSAQARGGR